MSTLQEQIDAILANRRKHLHEVEEQKKYWFELSTNLDTLCSQIRKAENLNREALGGTAEKLNSISRAAHDEEKRFRQIVERFDRNDICIGIGGAGRMGKSTFLQSVTGLGEEQIPTSDKFYTTAGRSLIVNSAYAEAIADMHTESTFLEKVIAPMCRKVKLTPPTSIREFSEMRVKLPEKEEMTQEKDDVLIRIRDAQKALPDISPELTGVKNRHISIENLRDYVAYPKGGKSKAGKFMAVAKITVYAPFPASAVKQLRVVDLPGLGEAGRDQAEVQTEGMSDVCDITLLMKRPVQGNVEWNLTDTNALDAMRESAPLLDDQTKYTAILANVNGESDDIATACVERIEERFQDSGRCFEIIRCEAKKRDAVISDTMPKVLTFLAKNLPEIDKAIFEKAQKESLHTKDGIYSALSEVKNALVPIVKKSNGNSSSFKDTLYNSIVQSLQGYADALHDKANGPDEEWNNEVLRVTEKVKMWVKAGCGYGSMQELTKVIRDEIRAVKGQPTQTINQLRIAFREQWEIIDEHLQSRIVGVLNGFLDAIKAHTHSFIPARQKTDDELSAVRKQLTAFAEKLMHTPDQEPGDEIALNGLTMPLRRLSEFDLRFRFHLEPTLIAATEVLVSNKLPLVKDQNDAESFADEITKMLTQKAEEYSKTMSATRAGNAAFEKKKKLIEGAVKDPTVCKELITMLQGAVSASQSFCPNRIFAAVVENAVDAFLRFKAHDQAFSVWIRGYETELKEEPGESERTALVAYASVSGITKNL